MKRGIRSRANKVLADVAQLVEHSLGKGEVTGSIPVISSRIGKCAQGRQWKMLSAL